MDLIMNCTKKIIIAFASFGVWALLKTFGYSLPSISVWDELLPFILFSLAICLTNIPGLFAKIFRAICVVLFMLVLMSLYCVHTNMIRGINKYSYMHVFNMEAAFATIENYLQKHGRYPSKTEWDILNEFMMHKEGSYYINIAINENLSSVDILTVADNTVFFVETVNKQGGCLVNELIVDNLEKNKLFAFKNNIFVIIYFADGRIGKFRPYDGSIAWYNARNGNFGDYHKNSPYLPLRWQP